MAKNTSPAPIAYAIVRNGTTFTWQGDGYRSEAGETIDTSQADVRRALSKAARRAACRIIEAQLEDASTLADLPQPGRVDERLIYWVGSGNLQAALAVRDLIVVARRNADWRPIGLDVLAEEIASGMGSFHAKWEGFSELSRRLEELQDLDLIVIYGGRVHFTQALLQRLPVRAASYQAA